MNLPEKLREALDEDLDTAGDIEDALENGGQLFQHTSGESFMVCEVHKHSRARLVYCWLFGGDLDELLDMIPYAEDWGRENGCDYAEFQGRIGFTRVLGKLGYEYSAAVMRKRLN